MCDSNTSFQTHTRFHSTHPITTTTEIIVKTITAATTPTIIPIIAPVDRLSSSESLGTVVVLVVGVGEEVGVVVGVVVCGGVVNTLDMGAMTTTVKTMESTFTLHLCPHTTISYM